MSERIALGLLKQVGEALLDLAVGMVEHDLMPLDVVRCMARDLSRSHDMRGDLLEAVRTWWAGLHPATQDAYLDRWGRKKPPCWMIPPYECTVREGA